MSLQSNRIIFLDNAAEIDFSLNLNDLNELDKTFDFVQADGDALFIGSDLPFNHRYFQFSTPNATAAALSEVALWDGQVFQPVLEFFDKTTSSDGSISMNRNGVIIWNKDPEVAWTRSSNSLDDGIFSGIEIPSLYWVRLRWGSDLDVGTSLRFVGHRFADDNDLGQLYPELNTSGKKNLFESGKTNWDPQHVIAAQEIIRKLRNRFKVINGNQILSLEQFKVPAVHKVAEMIFRAFGDDYENNRKQAEADFAKTFNSSFFLVDKDMNARESIGESIQSVRMRRR